MSKKIITIGILIMSIFCTYRCYHKAPMDIIFDRLEQDMDKERLAIFKKADVDSVVFKFGLTSSVLLKMYDDPYYKKNIDTFLNRDGILKNVEYRLYYIYFSFHDYLNHKKFDHQAILNRCDFEYYDSKDLLTKSWKESKNKNRKTLNQNSSRCIVGDTVLIKLPVAYTDGIKNAQHFYNEYDSYENEKYFDSLTVTGLITGKEYSYFSALGGVDTTDIIIKLKLLNLSNSSYKIFAKTFHIGDTLDLSLLQYKRVI